nr:hypothetical protein [Tanacetum cinerariifolium]
LKTKKPKNISVNFSLSSSFCACALGLDLDLVIIPLNEKLHQAIVEPLRIELPFLKDQFQEDTPPESLMAENRTMAELLQAPTEGYEDAIVILKITTNNFELKHGLINPVQNKQFFGHDKEDPHAHIRACPHHGFSELHQLDTFYNALNVNDQDSLNSAADVAELKDMVRALLLDKKNQYSAQTSSPTPAPIKAVEPNCVTCGGTHACQNFPTTCGNVYQDNIQEYVSQAATANYGQGNIGFRPQMVAN